MLGAMERKRTHSKVLKILMEKFFNAVFCGENLETGEERMKKVESHIMDQVYFFSLFFLLSSKKKTFSVFHFSFALFLLFLKFYLKT